MPRTITVRIPVAVDENGDWVAYGFTDHQIKDLSSLFETGVGEDLSGGERLYFVTVELAVPEPVIVVGQVEGDSAR